MGKGIGTLSAVAGALGLLACAVSVPADAANFSFAGTIGADDDVLLFNFSVGTTSTVTVRSYSYAGGTQANGNVIAAGGFDPILALFNSSGVLIDQQDDAGDDGFGDLVNADPVTGQRWDTYFQAPLDTGSYTVAVSQYNNFAGSTLAEGFERQGEPNFTASFGCTNGQFCDASGSNRINAWAFDVLNVDQAVVIPVPATLPLMLSALAGLGLLNRRRSRAA